MDRLSEPKWLLAKVKNIGVAVLDISCCFSCEYSFDGLDMLCYGLSRACFQLLGELLLDRHNFTIMTRYVSQPENLKTMMNMLRESSRNIQFEAFHVFKVQHHNIYSIVQVDV
jgi:Mo25-like